MNVRVKSVQSGPNESLCICFECEVGVGIGRWRADCPPKVDAVYSVEFDIDGSIDEHCARAGALDTFRIQQSGHELKLEGLLESVDADGVGYFRLAPDCLTMIDTSEGWDRPGTWLTITLSAERFEIVPIGLAE